jgi:hypothetical protein
MNEPPGARARVALSGLTIAEYFRDVEGQDVLFFVDNIFRFTQAGSEVSALLGRIPSAVGYQPTLSTDMGALQERITSTNKGSITSVQAIYVPADDLDRSGAGHLVRPLGRDDRAQPRDRGAGHLPGGRSARLDLAHARAAHRRPGALRDRPPVQETLQKYKSLQDIIAILGMDELSEEDKLTVPAPARSSASCRSRSTSPKSSPASPASSSRSKTPSSRSRRSSKANMIICRKPPSTWSAASTKRREGQLRTRYPGKAAPLGGGLYGGRPRHRG